MVAFASLMLGYRFQLRRGDVEDHLPGDAMEAASPTSGNKLHKACNNITLSAGMFVSVWAEQNIFFLYATLIPK